MRKILLTIFALTPLALLASDSNAQVDIAERTVNFFIFAAIIYYLLADKLKDFFTQRTQSIQAELDKVQDKVKESQKKVSDAKLEVENAKKVAEELVLSANNDVETIKSKIEASIEQEIENLSKSFEQKTELEMRKIKKEVVENVLEQLFSDDNIQLSQEELSNIVLKKVA